LGNRDPVPAVAPDIATENDDRRKKRIACDQAIPVREERNSTDGLRHPQPAAILVDL
jgi:hypothetical protein